MKNRACIIFFLLCISFHIEAYDFYVDGICYTKIFQTGNVSVSRNRANPYSGDIIIPSSITVSGTMYPVTEIEGYAFFDCSKMTSISLPPSVQSIDDYAFGYCSSLIAFTIPEGVAEIKEYTFSYCTGLKKIDLPSTLKVIERYAFADCRKLDSITIPASVATIARGVFYRTDSLKKIIVEPANISYFSLDGVLYSAQMDTLIRYPSAKEGDFSIPSSVVVIGAGSFNYCAGLKSVVVPSNVDLIESDAFGNCRALTSITLHDSIPPDCSSTAFESSLYSACTLFVQKGLLSVYNNNYAWRKFHNIQELTATSIDKWKNKGVTIFPNLVKDIVYIKGGLKNYYDVAVYNINGYCVFTSKVLDYVDVSMFLPGVYMFDVDGVRRKILKF